jgi:D-amino-acid dehydrogenase
MNDRTKHVVIVGAGVIGLCTAYYCAQRGHRVTVIEQGGESRDGCSYGNAGMVVPSHFVPLAAPGMVALGLKWMWNPRSPFYIRPRLDPALLDWGWKFWRAANERHVQRSAPILRDLSFASRDCFEELAALPGVDFGLVQRGLLMLCRTERALEHEAAFAERANRLGVRAEVLDARQTAARDPDVAMQVAGSVYFPNDCHLTPQRFMASLQQQLETMGVSFRWRTTASGFDRDHDRVRSVATDGESIAGDEFVIAGGSWSTALARELDLRLPMQAGKGYSLTLPSPRRLPQLCSILTEARVATTPMGATLRFGGTMEIAEFNERINPLRVQGIIDAVPKYFPEFTTDDFGGVRPWCGLRPCSPDGLPYIGRAGNWENVSVATGHAMMGLSLGPVTGKLMAELISGQKPSNDISLLNPNRYA